MFWATAKNEKLHAWTNLELIKFWECLLPLSRTFVFFPSSVRKSKDQHVQKYDAACSFKWVLNLVRHINFVAEMGAEVSECVSEGVGDRMLDKISYILFLNNVPSRTKLVQTGQLTFLRPSVRMVPVTFLSPLISPSYLSSFLSSSVWVTLSLTAELWVSKFRLGCRHQNSVRSCGRGQRPLLDPVVPNWALSWV